MKNILFRGSFSLQRKLLVIAVLAIIILPLASCSSFKDFFVNAKENNAGEETLKVDQEEASVSSFTDGGSILTDEVFGKSENEEGVEAENVVAIAQEQEEDEAGLSFYEILRNKFTKRNGEDKVVEEVRVDDVPGVALSSNASKQDDDVLLAAITEGEGPLTGANAQDEQTVNHEDVDDENAKEEEGINDTKIAYTDGGEIADTGHQDESKEVTLGRTTLSVGQIEHPFDLFPLYRITPGDVLDVLYQMRTWVRKENFKIAVDHTISVKFVHTPELNETQIIRPDGNITLPYLGEVSPVGKTISEFTAELKKAYGNTFRNPDIYVTVPEFQRNIKELKADLHTAPRGLSRLVTVRPDGFATFAMIGHIRVVGRTIPDVNDEINEMYDEMMPGLHCDLFLERQAGTVIYVVGEVKLPGAFNIKKPISVVEAIALAGSYLQGAKLESVIVARKHEDKVVCTRINLKKVLALREKSKFMYLQSDDIVYVPKTYVKRAGELARDIADIFLFNGWGSSVSFSYDFHNADTTDRGATTTPEFIIQ